MKENNKIQIDENNPSILICTYGTLRKHPSCGNYRNILEGRSEYLGTYKSEPAFTMYGLHSGFPIVCDHGETNITYDLFRVDNKDVLNRLHRLEGFSGVIGHPKNWYDMIQIETEHGNAYMYIQHEKFNQEEIITNGDWIWKKQHI